MSRILPRSVAASRSKVRTRTLNLPVSEGSRSAAYALLSPSYQILDARCGGWQAELQGLDRHLLPRKGGSCYCMQKPNVNINVLNMLASNSRMPRKALLTCCGLCMLQEQLHDIDGQ